MAPTDRRPAGGRSATRRVARVVGGAAALSLLGVGAVASTSLTRVGPGTSSAAMTVPVASQEAAIQAAAYQGDLADLVDQRVDASRASNLMASGTADAAREAQRQAEAKAAADAAAQTAAAQAAAAQAAAQAAADAAAADAARQAASAQAARDAQRSADPRSAAKAMLADYGWSASQFSCLDSLWTKESGWNPTATNGSSGAYGIPQSLPASKMASAGADYRTNPVTQITWGLNYIKSSYGSPCSAWAHSQAVNWY